MEKKIVVNKKVEELLRRNSKLTGDCLKLNIAVIQTLIRCYPNLDEEITDAQMIECIELSCKSL